MGWGYQQKDNEQWLGWVELNLRGVDALLFKLFLLTFRKWSEKKGVKWKHKVSSFSPYWWTHFHVLKFGESHNYEKPRAGRYQLKNRVTRWVSWVYLRYSPGKEGRERQSGLYTPWRAVGRSVWTFPCHHFLAPRLVNTKRRICYIKQLTLVLAFYRKPDTETTSTISALQGVQDVGRTQGQKGRELALLTTTAPWVTASANPF